MLKKAAIRKSQINQNQFRIVWFNRVKFLSINDKMGSNEGVLFIKELRDEENKVI